MLYRSPRLFKLWEFRVSHDQLLLRSPAGEEGEKNIDIVFLGFDYLNLPTMLPGVKLDQASLKESARVMGSLGRVSRSDYVYTLSSMGRQYFVVCAAFRVYENDLELFESSLEFSAQESPKGPGKILVHS